MSAWMLEILFDTLLYTGLLIAAVLVLRRPVARHFGPQIAYSLWALPFLRLIMPPIVLPASYAPEGEAMLETALAVPAAAPSAGAMTGDAGAAIAATPFASGWNWSDAALQLAEHSLLPLWLAGAVLFLGWRIVSYRRMRDDLLAEARPVGDVGRIRLVETPAVTAPVAFGVRDKVIALPQFFMAQRDIASRDLAIAHELAHHRGRDLLANFAAQAVLALHWFNPLAWIGWRAMRRDQEAACDARVLSGRGREDRVRYAALIANIAAGPRLALAAPMACPVLGEKSIIHRLRSLTMTETTRRQRLLGRSLVAAGALALPLTASIGYAAAAPLMPAAPLPPAPPAPPVLSTLQSPEPPAPPAPPEPPAVPHSARMTTSADGKTRVWVWRETDQNGVTRTRRVEAHSDDGQFDEDEMQRRMDEAEAARDRAEAERDRAEAQRERAEALREAGRERQQALLEAQQERSRALQEMKAEMARARQEVKQQLGADSPVSAAALRQIAVAEKAATSAAMQAMSFAFSCDGSGAPPAVAVSGKGATAVACGNSAMVVAMQGMKQARAAIAGNSAIPARERAAALRDIDASLAEMSQEL